MGRRVRLGAAGVACLLALASAPAAAQYDRVPDPSDGWEPVALEVVVSGGEPVACQLLLAHWFEQRLGPVDPGARATLDLLVRPASGDVALLNEVGDRMRIERLSCGSGSTPRRAWAQPSLDRLRIGGGTARLACRASDGETQCGFD